MHTTTFARASLSGEHPKRRSLEAEIMDWADDVTYSVHDTEDFYRAGMIPLDRILSDAPRERDRFFGWACRAGILRSGTKTVGTTGWATRVLDNMRELPGAEGLLRPYDASRDQCGQLKAFLSFLIGRYLGSRSNESVFSLEPTSPKSVLRVQESIQCEVQLLKGLMRCYVFDSPALLTQQYGHRRLITELFEILASTPDLVPDRYRAGETAEQARCASDFIASLTEQQALMLHKRVLGLEGGSVLDVNF
jgi:dGTPase